MRLLSSPALGIDTAITQQPHLLCSKEYKDLKDACEKFVVGLHQIAHDEHTYLLPCNRYIA